MVYDYEREVRTANSEAFLILDGEDVVGRIDTHFLPGAAHVSIAVEQRITPEQIEEIISDIDSDMLNTVGTERDTHCTTFFREPRSAYSAMAATKNTEVMATGMATGRCRRRRAVDS